MTTQTVNHGSFTIERSYRVRPERVFSAWANRDQKNQWFGEGDDFLEVTNEYALDFHVGGRERLVGRLADGREFRYEAIYQDIVANERFICTYDVSIDGRRNSVSLMTVELSPSRQGGTTVRLTEQGAFLDGLDSNEQRREGADDSLNKLEAYVSERYAALRIGSKEGTLACLAILRRGSASFSWSSPLSAWPSPSGWR